MFHLFLFGNPVFLHRMVFSQETGVEAVTLILVARSNCQNERQGHYIILVPFQYGRALRLCEMVVGLMLSFILLYYYASRSCYFGFVIKVS